MRSECCEEVEQRLGYEDTEVHGLLTCSVHAGSGPLVATSNGWLRCKAPFTRYNLLSNRLSTRFDKRFYRVYKHSTSCQTRFTTGLTTGCIVYTAGC